MAHGFSYQAQTPIRRYGAKPDKPDDRDRTRVFFEDDIPKPYDQLANLRQFVPKVYDQGNLASCTANAVCAAYGIDLVKQSQLYPGQGYYYLDPSRLFVYYNTREKEGTVAKDVGASIRDAVKALNKTGVCSENDWPYDTKKFAEKPPRKCYESAKGNNLCQYERLNQDLHQFRACLKQGYPIVFGFKIFRSFHNIESAGVMPMPSDFEKQSLDRYEGLHAVVAVGYDDRLRVIYVLNSWGSSWGVGGYFFMPYDFITDGNMCFDFWKITFACERGARR